MTVSVAVAGEGCRLTLSRPKGENDTARTAPMKAIVVTDEAAGTAGMTLVQRPEPPAAINDVIVQVHASGFVPTEMAWPSTWTDRLGRDRTPSIPGSWPSRQSNSAAGTWTS